MIAVTDDGLIYLAILLVAGPLVGWLANVFTVKIPQIAIQLYLMTVIGFIIYIVTTFLRATP